MAGGLPDRVRNVNIGDWTMIRKSISRKEGIVTKEKFLTVRWNNYLTLALGLPALIFVIYAYSTSVWSEQSGLIALAIIGVVY
jgi:hypothetical protein